MVKNKEAAFVLSYFNNCIRCSDRTKNVLGKLEIQSRIFHAFLIVLISTFTFSLFLYGIYYFLARKLANVYITDIAVGSLSSG